MRPVRLEGRRVVLRELEPSDFEAVHAYGSDPEVVRFLVWGPNEPAETEAFLRHAQEVRGRWRDSYLYAILADEWRRAREAGFRPSRHE